MLAHQNNPRVKIQIHILATSNHYQWPSMQEPKSQTNGSKMPSEGAKNNVNKPIDKLSHFRVTKCRL